MYHLLALEEREVFCAPERYDALEPRFLASRVQLMGQISGASILVPALVLPILFLPHPRY